MTHPELTNHNPLETVLNYWELDSPEIGEQFNKESPRLIFRIRTGTQDYLLKGLPCSIPETTVMSNVQAHRFLGNKNGMAPKIYPTKTGEFYVRHAEYWFYLMEFIGGRKMEETPEDAFLLGAAAKKLHALQGYSLKSPDSQRKERFYAWFRDRSFVREFDAILDALPDFETLDQCFVHTDLGPYNAMIRQDGEVIFIDLDDTGIGSRYLDLGWPFIMQFVDFTTEEMNYRFDLAQSFLKGYFGEDEIPRNEYDRIFDGAVQMHISYMKSYGDDAVDPLWRILLFGMEQKEILWEMISKKIK
jgi:Ser/Thr protein kinase RdoA (MazF antagonist)